VTIPGRNQTSKPQHTHAEQVTGSWIGLVMFWNAACAAARAGVLVVAPAKITLHHRYRELKLAPGGYRGTGARRPARRAPCKSHYRNKHRRSCLLRSERCA